MSAWVYWGGPAYCKTIGEVAWPEGTKTCCKPATGQANRTIYDSLGGKGIDGLVRLCGNEPAAFDLVGIAGFSAFHNLANPLLKEPASRERISFVHLADACFTGAGATAPHAGFAAFAAEAAVGKKLMVATTSGVPGQNVTYKDPNSGNKVTHANGSDSFKLVWESALKATGQRVDAVEAFQGLPVPVVAQRMGNLWWLDYQGTQSHENHANVLAAPLMTALAVSWMVGPGSIVGGDDGHGSGLLTAGAVALAALAGGAAFWATRRAFT
jgi:hypothetical protein